MILKYHLNNFYLNKVYLCLIFFTTLIFIYPYSKYLLWLKEHTKELPTTWNDHHDNLESYFRAKNRFPKKCSLSTDVEPFDNFIIPYLNTKKIKLDCIEKEDITFIDHEKGLMKVKKKFISKFYCFYSFIYQHEIYYKVTSYTEPKRIPADGVKLTIKNYVSNVSCYRIMDPKKRNIYKKAHLWIPDYPKTNASGPSVLIIVVESLSRLSFIRSMKKTASIFNKLDHVQIMSGLNKVADNSFPNSMALLANIVLLPPNTKKYREIKWDKKFDYIWENYGKVGYITGFLEDMARFGIFSGQMKGFTNETNDFIPRPFWLHVATNKDLHSEFNNSTLFCYNGHGPRIKHFFQQLTQFIYKMKKRNQPYFMYAFYAQYTHSDISSFQIVDEYVAKLLTKIQSNLNNTLLIVMGDHGPRFHKDYASIPLGALESRTPLFAIRVPETLNVEYSHLRKFLNFNKNRLLTWLDIYQLLKDVPKNRYEMIVEDIMTKSISPWRQISHWNRTCFNAGIIDMFCTCNGKIGNNPERSKRRAAYILHEYFNITKCKFKDNKLIKINATYDIIPTKEESYKLIQKINIRFIYNIKNKTRILDTIFKRKRLNETYWSKWTFSTSNIYTENKFKRILKKLYCNNRKL